MRVALTYDDGPSIWTPAILDLLAEAGAHATFFVLGERGPLGLYRYMVERGHEVGVHGYHHRRFSALSVDELDAELAATKMQIGLMETRLWRAPYLDFAPWMQERAEQFGLRHVGCDIDTADWMLDNPQRIADAALRAKDGDIILMHDGIPPDGGNGTRSRQATVDALRIILRQPWEFLTVSELWA